MRSVWLDTHRVSAGTTRLHGGETYDTVVVGAGLTGLAVAVMLAGTGRRVGVIEARGVGSVTTGNTTAKLSLMQGTQLSRIRERHGDEVVSAYVQSNLAAQAWLLEFMRERQVDHQRRAGITYATTDEGRRRLAAELEAATVAGLPAGWMDEPGLPFPVTGAIQLADQAQLHPVHLLDALANALVELGGVLHVNNRVQGVRTGDDGCRVVTRAGEVGAETVVLATGTPILNRGGHFARLTPQRSYALAFRVPGPIPAGMYLSVDRPTRSLRTVPVAGEERLLVGGNGHTVGRHDSTARLVADLEAWAVATFPGATRTHAWSAQDYQPANALPLVEELRFSSGRVQVATGYNKWGMANAVAAAMRIVGNLGGEPPAWARVLADASPTVAGAAEAAGFNLSVAGDIATGWGKVLQSLPSGPPAEAEGVVGRLGARLAARSTVNGATHTVSAVCTHLGGVLRWNNAECSWDCPLHGSRFDHAGRVLEGPALTDLPPVG